MRNIKQIEFLKNKTFFKVKAAQMVKNLPAMRETWVQSLGQEDPSEKGMVPTPLFMPGEFHGQRILAGYSPRGCKESYTTKRLTLLLSQLIYNVMLVSGI